MYAKWHILVSRQTQYNNKVGKENWEKYRRIGRYL